MHKITVLLIFCTLIVASCEQKTTNSSPSIEKQSMNIVYLKKANDDVISFCSCGDGRITFPAQINCPWCGCGWLFTCITCRKAFTFAEGVEYHGTWEELAHADIRSKWKEEPTEEDVASWIEIMKEMLADVQVGKRYVIIDGSVIPVDSNNIKFEGLAARHEFHELPQVRALADKAVLKEQLGNREYWLSNALPEDIEQ